MSVTTIKNEMLTMSQSELSVIINYANQIKSISATATFSVGQSVMVIQKTKQTLGTIVKMNTKKAVVEMPWTAQGNKICKVSVPYSMLEAA
tara:strand:+ start:69 stop:341 length:273 start_codon:yes stop_codon:yes gene_type:complete